MTPFRTLPTHTPDQIRDISVIVYRDRLGPDDTAKLVEEHGEAGLRSRAGSYDALTRAYLKAIGDNA